MMLAILFRSRDAMTRLLLRQRSVDSKFEERLPERDWTLRRAWRDVCDGLDRGKPFLAHVMSSNTALESEVRGAFINSLRTDVVSPLLELKVYILAGDGRQCTSWNTMLTGNPRTIPQAYKGRHKELFYSIHGICRECAPALTTDVS